MAANVTISGWFLWMNALILTPAHNLPYMKKILLFVAISLLSLVAVQAQNNAGLGTTTPNPSSILEMQSTTQGVLVPRVTAVQRLAITVNATTEGLLVYDLD